MAIGVLKTSNPADVQKALNLIGGIKKYVKKGDRVFVKPNLMIGLPSPVTTDPEVVAAVIKECFRAGAKEVMVGEDPLQQIHAKPMFEALDLKTYFEDLGAKVVYLDEAKHRKVPVHGLVIDEIRLPEPLLSADKYIMVPKMKTHIMTKLTCAVKLNQGIIIDEDKLMSHRNDLHAKLVDMLLIAKPDLIVVDGIVGMEGGGPVFGDGVQSNVLVVGDNAVAVDIEVAKIMGLDPEEIETNRLGLLTGKGKEEKAVGDRVRLHFKKAIADPSYSIPNIRVSCAGADQGILGHIRYGIDMMTKFFPEELKKVDDLVIYGGWKPKILPNNRNVIIFGDAAIASVRVNAKKVVRVPGDPPGNWIDLFGAIAKMFGLPMLDYVSLSLKRFKHV